MKKRVLIVVTSHAQMGTTEARTGMWLEEFAVPFYRFKDSGVEVELASPRGGSAPIEPKSVRAQGENDAAVERFLADPSAQRQVEQTRKLDEVGVASYDAIFLPGGHGTMWDLPDDPGVQRAVEIADRAGMVIGAVCHGPAGLVSARGADGQPLVMGKRVTAFTNAEESAAGLTNVVPFLLESRMRELGALFQNTANWQSFVVRDGRLVTGQNPASSAAVADQMMAALAESGREVA